MLDISRKDILADSIMDFDAASRFIKLPISEYLYLTLMYRYIIIKIK